MVCLLVTTLKPASTHEATDMPFVIWTRGAQETTSQAGARDPHVEGALLRETSRSGTCSAVDILKVTHRGQHAGGDAACSVATCWFGSE